MIALNAERSFGYFGLGYSSPRNALQNDVFVNGDAIEHNFAEHGRFGLAALGIKFGCLKMDFQVLPQSRGKRSIHPWRVPFIIRFGSFNPTWINGSCILVFGSSSSPGVEQLYLVTALQVNARIGTLWEHKIEFEINVAVLQHAVQIRFGFVLEFIAEIVKKHAIARFSAECFALRTAAGFAYNLPVGAGCAKAIQVVEGQGTELVKRRLGITAHSYAQEQTQEYNSVVFLFVNSH